MWPFKCLISMILTMTKYHENLLRDSPLSLLSVVKFLSSLETKKVLKIPNETFLRITRYKKEGRKTRKAKENKIQRPWQVKIKISVTNTGKELLTEWK